MKTEDIGMKPKHGTPWCPNPNNKTFGLTRKSLCKTTLSLKLLKLRQYNTRVAANDKEFTHISDNQFSNSSFLRQQNSPTKFTSPTIHISDSLIIRKGKKEKIKKKMKKIEMSYRRRKLPEK